MSYSFQKPNQASQLRANRISKDTWENYRGAIIEVFKSVDRNGVAHTHEWVEDQNFPDFKPSLKQLRHRINVTWMNSDAERPYTSDTLDSRTPDTITPDTITPDMRTPNTRTPDSEDTSNSHSTLDSPGILESPNTSVSNTTDSTEEIESSRDSESPRTSESSGTSGERGIASSPIAKLEGFPYVTSVIRIPTEKRTLRARLKTFNVSPLMGIPEEVMVILSPVSHPNFDMTGPVSMKRRVGTSEAREMRKWKRQKDDNTAATTLNGSQKLPVNVTKDSTASWSGIFSISLARSPSPVPLIKDSLTLPDRDFLDPVLDPKRLQRLLAIIGIEWNFDAVARCLRKAIVLRDSSANATDGVSLPASAYSAEHITKVQNLAEFLFASSLLEEAFPLFLHLWTVRRGDFTYKGAKSLIQCVRSAVSTGDQSLIRALLKREMLVLASPRHNLMRSLGYLELANVFQHQQHEEEFKQCRHRARSACPSFGSLLDAFYEAGQKLHDIRKPQAIYGMDSLSEIIMRQAFQNTECSQYCDIPSNKSDNNIGEHTLRDVLSAAVYLKHPNQPNAAAGVRHIRNCLQFVFGVLSSTLWLSSYELFSNRILQYLSGNPRSHEYALFLSLWLHWRERKYHIDPHEEDLTLNDDASFIGLSVVEVLSVITYCILSGKPFHDFLQSTFGSNDPGSLNIPLFKGDRVLGLLQLPDAELMFVFLWCSVKLSRMNTAEGRWRQDSLAQVYKVMMIDTYNTAEGNQRFGSFATINIFDTSGYEEWNTTTQPKSGDTDRPTSAMTGISFNPTLAKSLSTTPTLASMRRQGWSSSSSTRSYRSNQAMAVDDLSEWTSSMSISDIGNSRPASARDVPVGDAEDIGLAGQDKEPLFEYRIGPSKPLPPLPVTQGVDTYLSKPADPTIIVSGLAPYNENPLNGPAIDTSIETTVPLMYYQDSTMDHTPP